MVINLALTQYNEIKKKAGEGASFEILKLVNQLQNLRPGYGKSLVSTLQKCIFGTSG